MHNIVIIIIVILSLLIPAPSNYFRKMIKMILCTQTVECQPPYTFSLQITEKNRMLLFGNNGVIHHCPLLCDSSGRGE